VIAARQAWVVWCSLCLVEGKRELATVAWEGAPICRPHFVECGGVEEEPEGVAYAALSERPR
jgi:hypothetical protein